jgi:beta-fructofuranosidase
VEEPVLKSPEAGWDEFQVWAPHIIEYDGEYWMFYTGVNEACCQAIGLARSKDLFHWERHPGNPVIRTGEWGLWDPTAWSDCRDPMVLKDGDTFYCYYTAARATGGEPPHESCVGVSSSKDLIHWRDEGFIRLTESLRTPPESPFVVKRGDKYYLFYTNYGLGTVYAVSDHPVTGFVYPGAEEMRVIPEVSASEIYQDGDDWYISLISHAPNALHFFEIRRLVWAEDGTVSVVPLEAE